MPSQDCFSSLFKKKKKEKGFFIENGARLLKETISSCDGIGVVIPIQIFTAEELEKATDNYDERHILVMGGMYTAYKGTHEGRPIVVRKMRFLHYEFLTNVFNEIVMLSQIHHKHVVKLLGCCIETQDPRPVYEFIGNGDLEEHLFPFSINSNSISWEYSLRIATEVASAVNYLHLKSPKPIVHNGILSKYILLDENYTAKLSNFGNSETVVLGDETEMDQLDKISISETETTHGNNQIDASSVFRHDILCYGRLLVSILTAKIAPPMPGTFIAYVEERRNLLKMGSALLGQENLHQTSQWIACAELALRCIQDDNEKPTMKQVVQELTRITNSKKTNEAPTLINSS